MPEEKVQSIIEEKLNVTPGASPTMSEKSSKSNEIKLEVKDKTSEDSTYKE